jgi:hypothetical protein
MLLTYIQKVRSRHLAGDTDIAEGLFGFLQSLQANASNVTWNKPQSHAFVHASNNAKFVYGIPCPSRV